MRSLKYLFAATIIAGLAGPAMAQTDPHHPAGTEAAPSVDGTGAAPPAEMPVPVTAEPTTTACPDMMSMMKMMMQPGAANAQSMQMMQMMQSMQMMQTQLMQQMQLLQQMQPGAQQQEPDLPDEGASP